MPDHYSFSNAPPPPPALYEILVQALGPAAAAQLLGGAGPAAGGGVAAQGLATQLAGAQALSRGVMAGVPPAEKHPTPNMDVPKPRVDTSSRDSLLGSADLLAGLGGGAGDPATPPLNPNAGPGPQGGASNFLTNLLGKDGGQDLLQFGLRLMAGSEAQPGTTRGPSLMGAIGQAGVGTLKAAAHRKALEAKRRGRAPTSRTVNRGDQVITEEWDPSKGWIEIGKGPRFKPSERGGPTDPQIANNSEIDQARQRLEELEQGLQNGTTLGEELNRRMSSTDPSTGLLTPDFSSFWGQIARTAMQSKVGVDDPDQAMWSRRLMMPPQFSDPAGAKPLPPGLEGAEPSGIGGFLEGLFGGDASGAAPASPAAQPGSMPPPGAQGGSPISPNPLAGSFLNPASASGPTPGQAPTVTSGISGASRPFPDPGSGTPRAFNPRGLPSGRLAAPGSTPRGAGKPIPQMSIAEVHDFLDARGESLTVAERNQIDARLRALGF